MFFFMAKYSITWIYYTTFSRFTHQLGFFFSHFLGIMNNGVVKIHVQSFFFLSFLWENVTSLDTFLTVKLLVM